MGLPYHDQKTENSGNRQTNVVDFSLSRVLRYTTVWPDLPTTALDLHPLSALDLRAHHCMLSSTLRDEKTLVALDLG